MGCSLSQFKITGRKRTEALSDGRVLKSAKARSGTLTGVVYWIDEQFQGFCGSHAGAKANALDATR